MLVSDRKLINDYEVDLNSHYMPLVVSVITHGQLITENAQKFFDNSFWLSNCNNGQGDLVIRNIMPFSFFRIFSFGI